MIASVRVLRRSRFTAHANAGQSAIGCRTTGGVDHCIHSVDHSVEPSLIDWNLTFGKFNGMLLPCFSIPQHPDQMWLAPDSAIGNGSRVGSNLERSHQNFPLTDTQVEKERFGPVLVSPVIPLGSWHEPAGFWNINAGWLTETEQFGISGNAVGSQSETQVIEIRVAGKLHCFPYVHRSVGTVTFEEASAELNTTGALKWRCWRDQSFLQACQCN